jgi:hypothetical protein
MRELIVRDRPDLDQRFRAVVVHLHASEMPDDSPVKNAVAARLNELLKDPRLSSEPALSDSLETIRKHDDGSFDDLDPEERNRILIECGLSPFIRTMQDQRLAAIIQRIHQQQHAALCLSGGGIRSASFAMGIVQGLARHGLLSKFQYLSTVSGGGYTGSWLTAWMARSGAERVHKQLGAQPDGRPNVEPSTIRHIRTFSYYLTPRFTMMSADTWTLIATVARNVLLIWFVMIPVMAAGLMLPRLIMSGPMLTLMNWHRLGYDPGSVVIFMMTVGTLLAVVSISFVQRHLYSYSARLDSNEPPVPATLHDFLTRCLAPLVIAMVTLAQGWEMLWAMIRLDPADKPRFERALGHPLSHHEWAMKLIDQNPTLANSVVSAIVMGIFFWVFVYLSAWAVSARGRKLRAGSGILSALAGAFAGLFGAIGAAQLFGLTEWRHRPEFFATFAVPLSLTGLLIAKQVVVGLASRTMTDAGRESNARFSAWLLIAIVSWISICGVALYGPILLGDLIHNTARMVQLVGLSGITGGIASVLAGSKQTTPNAATNSNGSESGGITALLQKVAIAIVTPLFVVLVIILISLLDASLLFASCKASAFWCPQPQHVDLEKLFQLRLPILNMSDFASPHLVLGVGALLLGVGYILGRFISTNRFSLHAMYRVRLVRTFLGASKPPGERKPDPFTGFDDTDDMPIGRIWPDDPREKSDDAPPDRVRPPLHVLNLTLNTVAGTDLATQNRKAISFTVSPFHAGAAGTGYRRTRPVDDEPHQLFGAEQGISLGTAMAISGAAASPNSGYHSSPSVTFLMTLFNARLGWWLGNPGPAGKRTFGEDEPRLALEPILDEMFGRTTDHSPYVYLSDGGHFENLGLYEMVRRRCRFIVVSDAGCDPEIAFDDLGGAIRKIRIDFGIPIEFEGRIPIYPRSTAETTPKGAKYWAVGKIRYSCVDTMGDAETPAPDGILLYIKPTFYEQEPYDVVNYGKGTPTFPHESTGNQFFGEAQFESYRALGSYVMDQMYEEERGNIESWFRPAGVNAPADGYQAPRPAVAAHRP